MKIEAGLVVRDRFVTHEVPGPTTRWYWSVSDGVLHGLSVDGVCDTEAEAWRQMFETVAQASPVMVARAQGVTAGLDAMRARAEAAEKRAEAAEAAGYRRAIDDACAALDKRYDVVTHRLGEGDHFGAGRLRGLDLAEEIVRALAPVEPVNKAEELPAGGEA